MDQRRIAGCFYGVSVFSKGMKIQQFLGDLATVIETKENAV